jgi:hypothetical protein
LLPQNCGIITRIAHVHVRMIAEPRHIDSEQMRVGGWRLPCLAEGMTRCASHDQQETRGRDANKSPAQNTSPAMSHPLKSSLDASCRGHGWRCTASALPNLFTGLQFRRFGSRLVFLREFHWIQGFCKIASGRIRQLKTNATLREPSRRDPLVCKALAKSCVQNRKLCDRVRCVPRSQKQTTI